MSTLREAAQQALEALEEYQYHGAPFLTCDEAAAALRAALAQQAEPVEPVREPVAWIHTDLDKPRVKFLEWSEDEPGYRGCWIKTPLYLSPPQRQPLTDEEILKAIGWERAEMYMKLTPNFPVAEAKKETLKNARAIERAHGIGEAK